MRMLNSWLKKLQGGSTPDDRRTAGSGQQASLSSLTALERETLALVETLASEDSPDVVAGLKRRGTTAARMLAMAMSGELPPGTRWGFVVNGMDDMALEPMWRLHDVLVAIGSEAAEYVRPLLENKRWQTRFMAIHTLGDLRDRQAVEAIAGMLLPPSFRMTSAAVDALGKIGDPRAIPYLESVENQLQGYEREAVRAAIRACRH